VLQFSSCDACNRLGLYVKDVYALPEYPAEILEHPEHPLYDAAAWDNQFMTEQGWDWAQFYGALQELRTGHNPNHTMDTIIQSDPG
jgi:hypothetical protein